MLIRTLTLTLAAAMAIATTGCGTDSTTPALATYIARSSSTPDTAPQLFTLNVATKKSTEVSIPIPENAVYVSSNVTATAVTYCYDGDSGYDIFLMGMNGQEQELTTGADACESVFSPDGKTIAYVSGASGDAFGIYTMNVDGSNQTAFYLPAADTADAFYPEFSPDGKSLVFYVSVDGGPSRQVHPQGNGRSLGWPQIQNRHSKTQARGSARPQTTPTQSGWYTMALTDTAPTFVYAPNGWWGPAVFSGDNTKILFTQYDGTQNNIFSVDLDGSNVTELTTSTTTYSFSPVAFGNSILFNQWDSTNSSWDIYIMDETGANQALVSSTASTYETLIDSYWSND
jgi:Tol biopolymer transport system component